VPEQSSESQRQIILEEAERVLASPEFATTPRLARLLRFLVDESLANRLDSLKESVIAVEVFDRATDHDPQLDSVVRVQIGRLRARLAEYYLKRGSGPVRIEIPKGNYQPVFGFSDAPEPQPKPRSIAIPAIVAAVVVLIAATWAVVRFKPSATAGPATIAVLPFLNLSGDKSFEYVGDSITDEITEALAESNDLRVVARTSAFQYKGRNVDVRQIGRELNAGALLEGSVTTASPQKFRIVVQLIRSSDGYHLWSHAYDVDSAAMVSTEAEIARAAGEKLVPRLKGVGRTEGPQTTANGEAHDLYMRAMYQFHLRTAESEREALRLAKEASAKDPGYVLPHTLMAQAESELSTLLIEPPREAAAHAKEAIAKALSLDPSSSDAHAEKALFAYTDDWDWPQAEREFRLALAQGSRAQAHNLYGWSLMTRGRFEEARSHLRIAAELDPQSTGPALNQSMNSLMNRNVAESKRQLDAILVANPRSFAGLFLRTAVALWEKDCAAASSYSGKIKELYPNVPASQINIVMVSARCGHPEQARAFLAAVTKGTNPAGYASPYSLALLYAALSDVDGVMQALQKSADAREPVILYLKVEPAWDPFRADPRFQALERTVGLLDEK
jgi:serine/threonine-protein kinase